MDRCSLPELTHRRRDYAARAGAHPPRYATVAARGRDGDIPATFDGRQWWVRTEDIEAAARFFGFIPPCDSRLRRAA